MMKRYMLGLLASSVLLLALPGAQAGLIDTGVPAGSPIGLFLSEGLAGKFTLPAASRITGVEWYMGAPYGTGSLTFKLMDDKDYAIPGGTVLYTAAPYAVTATTDGAWLGPTGLAWDVAAGKYWIDVYPGFSVTVPTQAPTPLSMYAYWQESTPGNYVWAPYGSSAGYGVRIYYGAVPEPASVLLLGLALIGLAGRRK